jgi:hypothetical protein
MKKRDQINYQLYELYFEFNKLYPKLSSTNDYYVINTATRTALYDMFYGEIRWHLKGFVRDFKGLS